MEDRDVYRDLVRKRRNADKSSPTYKDAYKDVYMHLLKAHIAYRDLLVTMMMLMGMPIGDLLLLIGLPIRMAISSLYGCLSGSPTANKGFSRDFRLLIRMHMDLLLHIEVPMRMLLARKGIFLWFS